MIIKDQGSLQHMHCWVQYVGVFTLERVCTAPADCRLVLAALPGLLSFVRGVSET
jgi:hypothetical protein